MLQHRLRRCEQHIFSKKNICRCSLRSQLYKERLHRSDCRNISRTQELGIYRHNCIRSIPIVDFDRLYICISCQKCLYINMTHKWISYQKMAGRFLCGKRYRQRKRIRINRSRFIFIREYRIVYVLALINETSGDILG